MKLTTKLVLGATVVVGLTTATFAACANDVAMGGKKLTGLADGGMAGEAVHYGQVFTPVASAPAVMEGNFSTGTGAIELKAYKIGGLTCVQGLVKNTLGATRAPAQHLVATLPSGYGSTMIYSGLATYDQWNNGQADSHAMVHGGGRQVYVSTQGNWVDNGQIYLNGCYPSL